MAKQSVIEAKKLEAQQELVDQVTKLAFAVAALSERLDVIEAKLDKAVGANTSEPAPKAPAKRGKKASQSESEGEG